MERMAGRWPTTAVGVLLALAVALGCQASRAGDGPGDFPHDRAPRAAASGAVRVEAVEVLRAWQRRRAAAWAAGDVVGLRGLYVDRAAARPDVRLLRLWLRRGLVVEGMAHQLLAHRVLEERNALVRVSVTQRLVGATVRLADGRQVPLPRTRPERRDVTLVRTDGEWRVLRIE